MISADSNPGGSRHPLDTPPPRYVSVVALNEIEKSEKKAAASRRQRDEIETSDDSGLPTYEEAVMQQESDPATVVADVDVADVDVDVDGAVCNEASTEGKRRKENIVKISMV